MKKCGKCQKVKKTLRCLMEMFSNIFYISIFIKELSLCHKLWFSSPYIFVNPLNQTLSISDYELVKLDNLSIKLHQFAKFQRLEHLIEFVTKIQPFSILSIHKSYTSWCHARSHTKCGPDRFSHSDVYWIQTDKQTDRQAKDIYIQIQKIFENISLKQNCK